MLEDSPCLLRGLWVASASHASCAIANRDHGLRDSSPVITGCFHGRLFAGESTVDYYEEPAGARGQRADLLVLAALWTTPPPKNGSRRRAAGSRPEQRSVRQKGKTNSRTQTK